MKNSSVFEIVTQIVILALVGLSLINAAPVQDDSDMKLVRVARHPATTYKYQDAIAAYTFSPFAPKTSPTTTTTTTPIPITTTKKPWWKLWR
ncbi:AAEL004591-PA [Aedes aegypti]|uniref:AAEL004591-PA n=1 Tax=Aedes aegypti TaxID=7159 RepID=Q17CF8_AEDAE|nr:AAEL004591-PA [Aedes aegypti]